MHFIALANPCNNGGVRSLIHVLRSGYPTQLLGSRLPIRALHRAAHDWDGHEDLNIQYSKNVESEMETVKTHDPRRTSINLPKA